MNTFVEWNVEWNDIHRILKGLGHWKTVNVGEPAYVLLGPCGHGKLPMTVAFPDHIGGCQNN